MVSKGSHCGQIHGSKPGWIGIVNYIVNYIVNSKRAALEDGLNTERFFHVVF